MKIIKKKSESYHYEPEKFCCKKMKKAYRHSIIFNYDTRKLAYRTDEDNGYNLINYCPFCGERIEYESNY